MSERINAINDYARAYRRLVDADPEFEQQEALSALREVVLVWRTGDDPRRILGVCERMLRAHRLRPELAAALDPPEDPAREPEEPACP